MGVHERQHVEPFDTESKIWALGWKGRTGVHLMFAIEVGCYHKREARGMGLAVGAAMLLISSLRESLFVVLIRCG